MSLHVDWAWIASHMDEAWTLFVEHLVLTGLAVGIGLLLSTALAILALRWRATYAPVTSAAGVLYTIPSIATFALVTPAFGLTMVTAEIALVSYTILILVRNIVAGIDGVPDDVVEAARGMGYRGPELLVKVQLPLAVPVIIAGVRIATVTTIGLVTISALITYGGFGHFILRGLRRQFFTEILLGIVLSVLLATVIDALLVLLERRLTPWTQRAEQTA